MSSVVIVDDSIFIRSQLQKFFEEVLNFQVLALGSDGHEAIQLYEEKQPDLLTIDLTMPNKNGLEAIREIVKNHPDAKILVISAINESSLITESLHVGAKSYFHKPLDLSSPEFVQSFKDELNAVLAD